MRKFSNILKRNSAKRESSQIETISEFKNFAHKQLSENSTYDFDVVEQLLESLLVDNKNDINKSLDGLKVFTESVEQVDEGRREPLELTPKKFFVVFDYMSVFDALYDLWLEYNDETWYSSHIANTLDCTKRYIDQYASLMSYHHKKYAKAELNIPNAESVLKNKQFANVVKRSVEWKALRDFLKGYNVDEAVKAEDSQGIAIVKSVFKEVERFITIVSSK